MLKMLAIVKILKWSENFQITWLNDTCYIEKESNFISRKGCLHQNNWTNFCRWKPIIQNITNFEMFKLLQTPAEESNKWFRKNAINLFKETLDLNKKSAEKKNCFPCQFCLWKQILAALTKVNWDQDWYPS